MAAITFCPAVFSQDAAVSGAASSQHTLVRAGLQGIDSIPIQGVNTAATVRGCNLANMEALINIVTNGSELLGIVWGAYLLLQLIRPMTAAQRCKKFAFALIPIAGGVALPYVVNYLVATARDLNLFS